MYFAYSNLEMNQNRNFYEMMYDSSHHLVKIDQVMDWDFLSRKLESYFLHQIGRPTKDPIILGNKSNNMPLIAGF